ncbi:MULTISPECIES: YfhL family 4Fe-4S dicluster ferredoxin [Dehalococcoides]|jgi:ferredoxin|uniref:4Fe-4S ferredoxin n=2 Tax=Dehalococcoides mccartyi TaxID=61435 RepID=A0A142V8Q1_9CHLR|nr:MULTISPECIES: YfhL family 4Fe-4S dicluster ferredoxin [Dehalococcoides]AGG05825.1 ferredoxin, Alvin family [Dehalococcoides mccartyi DCMB5]AGG07240.1 ferredoxin, Alvin family [Dehalococcoides mccartyi BTF08]AII60389.1 4Fe-4S ferredoxin [Dehalococcoides mccartyi CG5]AMU86029.1 iron-sulfur cluster-binding protein [Dehalococcoides mccartyi]AOV98838.1 4Fe-4S ferredoxin, iron-sulfur binding [Dehalococcoides mccartyi]
MSFKITDDCISCGACEPECPNKAISEGETIYIIDPEKCSECVGAFDTPQCVEICPVDSCVKCCNESNDELLAKWQKQHPGESPK